MVSRVKKLLRGNNGGDDKNRSISSGGDDDSVASVPGSLQCDSDNFADLISPMKDGHPREQQEQREDGAELEEEKVLNISVNGTPSRGRSTGGWGIRRRIVTRRRGRSRSIGRRTESKPSDTGPSSPPPTTAPFAPGRSVKFADEGSTDMPLTTTKFIHNGSPEGDSIRSVASLSSASSVSSPSRSISIQQQPSPGEGFVGTPPQTNAEVEQYWRRVLVMLLSPKTHQFEIVAIYHDERERTGLSNVLRQVSKVATSSRFAGKRYKGLTRPNGPEAGVEMINALSLRDYTVQPDEVLVAIPRGMTGQQVAPMASALLSDGRVRRMVNRIVTKNTSKPTSSTMYGGFKRVLTRSRRKIKRRLRKTSTFTKMLCSVVTIVILITWLYFFASPYLPNEFREAIEAKADLLGELLPAKSDQCQTYTIWGKRVLIE